MLDLIEDSLFYCPQYCTYPPFKCGYYLEEYFLDYMQRNDEAIDHKGRSYIPALWTAMQIEGWFPQEKSRLQTVLNRWIENHPNPCGYFTVVQHDDGVLFDLPKGTIVYSACSGGDPEHAIPLIYQDTRNTLESIPQPLVMDRSILCSFVGTTTHPIRSKCYEALHDKPGFEFHMNPTWTNAVNKGSQDLFIDTTLKSRFALAPRGYGRSSFRFYEIFKLGAVPIYVWDDIEWLPYPNVDYRKFCISIHESQIADLPKLLAECNYQEMRKEYEKVKHMFELDFMCQYILGKQTT